MFDLLGASHTFTVRSHAIPILGGQPALVPLKLRGREGVNAPFEYCLTLQTPDALRYMGKAGSNLDLNAVVMPSMPTGKPKANRNFSI